jgi:hypothetical protein
MEVIRKGNIHAFAYFITRYIEPHFTHFRSIGKNRYTVDFIYRYSLLISVQYNINQELFV